MYRYGIDNWGYAPSPPRFSASIKTGSTCHAGNVILTGRAAREWPDLSQLAIFSITASQLAMRGSGADAARRTQTFHIITYFCDYKQRRAAPLLFFVNKPVDDDVVWMVTIDKSSYRL